MIRKEGKGCTLITASGSTIKANKSFMYSFNSINEFVSYINSHNRIPGAGDMSTEGSSSFCGTKSFNEALTLLQNGWEEGAKLIDKGLKEKLSNSTDASARQRSVYDVVGGNASVPRYLQGVPTNMIRQVRTPIKQPVVDLDFNFCFPNRITKESIIDTCIKTLQKVVALENAGTRVNLYACKYAAQDGVASFLGICIKKSTERLNILKLAFPVAHPSMLRRIAVAFDERNSDMPTSWFFGYGNALKFEENQKTVQEAFK